MEAPTRSTLERPQKLALHGAKFRRLCRTATGSRVPTRTFARKAQVGHKVGERESILATLQAPGRVFRRRTSGKILGATRSAEHGAALARARQAKGRAGAARVGLWLVQRPYQVGIERVQFLWAVQSQKPYRAA